MNETKWTATIYDCPYCGASCHFNSNSYQSEKLAIRKTMLSIYDHFKMCPDYRPGKIKTNINITLEDSQFGYKSYKFLKDKIIL